MTRLPTTKHSIVTLPPSNGAIFVAKSSVILYEAMVADLALLMGLENIY
jgi:hypothetical protein